MKIKELISKLELYNQEMEVKLMIDDGNTLKNLLIEMNTNNECIFEDIISCGIFGDRERCFYIKLTI